VPHFQNICYLSLCHDFALNFGDEAQFADYFYFEHRQQVASLLEGLHGDGTRFKICNFNGKYI
jgi:hypothetical protein